ncbi:hypothetical protein B7463_g11621, partial [Scytalidium lignicola]
MASSSTFADTAPRNAYTSDSEDGRASGGRKAMAPVPLKAEGAYPLNDLPSSEGLRKPAGSLLKGATDDNGQLKTAGLMVGIKLDLEAEVHLTARVRGDIVIGLY